jgi:hypothetical protein
LLGEFQVLSTITVHCIDHKLNFLSISFMMWSGSLFFHFIGLNKFYPNLKV